MTDPIRLTSAVKADKGLSHQTAAWNWLQEQQKPEVLAQFAELYRADPPVKDPSPSPGLDWLTPCLALVQEFEGCRLDAYPDPGTGGDPWTIGWGATTMADGQPVKPGDTITQATADALLAAQLQGAHRSMLAALPMAAEWSGNRQAALTSFAYNIGGGALAESTLRQRLISGEDPARAVSEELPRWNKGGSGVLQGLVRRRAAEVALFCGGTTPVQMPRLATNPLTVPYLPQLDNGPEGWRQCQTSSIAMCLAYLKVPGITDDTDYLKIVQRYGDTTDQAAHQKALASLNVRARFRQNMTATDLMGELKGGLPVAIGVLHHGPATAPTGGGHYITAIGFTDDSWIVNDPYGELDLVNGGWAKQGGDAGKGQRYSFRNLNPRWLPEGPASGWGWVFS